MKIRNNNLYDMSGHLSDSFHSFGVLLRYMLVVFLMITPLGSVIAGTTCSDMAGMSMAYQSSSLGSASSRHANNDSSMQAMHADMSKHTTMSGDNCCAGDGCKNCHGHCHLNVHVSMFLQSGAFLKPTIMTSSVETIIYHPVFIQQTPLLRPPSVSNS